MVLHRIIKVAVIKDITIQTVTCTDGILPREKNLIGKSYWFCLPRISPSLFDAALQPVTSRLLMTHE